MTNITNTRDCACDDLTGHGCNLTERWGIYRIVAVTDATATVEADGESWTVDLDRLENVRHVLRWVDDEPGVKRHPTGRSAYKPGHARVGEPTPQSDPDAFSVEDLRAEARYLLNANRRWGTNDLRTLAYLKLLRIAAERES